MVNAKDPNHRSSTRITYALLEFLALLGLGELGVGELGVGELEFEELGFGELEVEVYNL